MFLYFPENYGWSLTVLRCMASGGHFGEIDWVCQNLREAAAKPPRGDAMSVHGMACLGLDLPGQGITLRLSGLPARHDTEVPVGATLPAAAN